MVGPKRLTKTVFDLSKVTSGDESTSAFRICSVQRLAGGYWKYGVNMVKRKNPLGMALETLKPASKCLAHALGFRKVL